MLPDRCLTLCSEQHNRLGGILSFLSQYASPFDCSSCSSCSGVGESSIRDTKKAANLSGSVNPLRLPVWGFTKAIRHGDGLRASSIQMRSK